MILINFIILYFKQKLLFYKIEFNYLFNISLSISTGLIVNLIFLIITNAKERYINYHSSIIPILQKRRNQLSGAYHECWPQMSIAYQQNDKDKWYKYWHRLVNMSCVAIDFHNFLIERLPNDYKYDDNFEKNSDKLTDLNNMAFKFVNTDEKIDFKELNTECEKELHVIFTIIMQLDSLQEKLQLNLYSRLYRN